MAYERSKLRWHFAVATFDSAATALRVYHECNAIEFSQSAVPFDLRFVPESAQFTHLQVCLSTAPCPCLDSVGVVCREPD